MKFTLYLTTAMILIPLAAFSQKKTVCTVTINSNNERQAFEKNLPKSEFQFVELTDFDANVDSMSRGSSQWFKKACQAQVQCDILVFSGHFGGSFFGSSGYYLPMEPLERNSCANTCDGILKRPREVFMFGCNTLAEKDRDHRSQAEYVNVLVADGYGRVQAERMAEMRYGAVGETFKDRMRRIFQGVPHLYGFNSTSPLGSYSGPQLASYFKSVGNYSDHLLKMANSSEKNTQLKSFFSETSLVESSGVGSNGPQDPSLPFRNQICSVYDPKISLAAKTQSVAQMLKGPDRMLFMNTAANFLRVNQISIQLDPPSKRILETVAQDKATLADIDRTEKSFEKSIALRLDIMQLKMQLGVLSKSEFENQAANILLNSVRDLDRSDIDVLCSSMREYDFKISVKYEDFLPGALATVNAAAAFRCLKTDDTRITEAILANYKNSYNKGTETIRAWFLGMMRLPGFNQEKINLANHLIKTAPSFVHAYAYGLLAVASSGDRRPYTDKLAQFDLNSSAGVYDVMADMEPQTELGEALIASLSGQQGEMVYRKQVQAIIGTLPTESPAWKSFAEKFYSLSETTQVLVMWYIAMKRSLAPSMVDQAIRILQSGSNWRVYSANALAKSDLSLSQIAILLEMSKKSPISNNGAMVRWILSKKENVDSQTKKGLQGPALRILCTSGDQIACQPDKVYLTWDKKTSRMNEEKMF